MTAEFAELAAAAGVVTEAGPGLGGGHSGPVERHSTHESGRYASPVWALGDAVLVRRDSKQRPKSYAEIATHADLRLGIVSGTVQADAARNAGVKPDRNVPFKSQPDAVAALLKGEVDAYPSTAVGHRVLVKEHPQLVAVDLERAPGSQVPVGGFFFNKKDKALADAVNAQLKLYLGSADHRSRMARFGLSNAEIDSIAVK